MKKKNKSIKPPHDPNPFTPQQADKDAPILSPEYLTEGYDVPCKYCGNKLKKFWLFGAPEHGGCVNKECKNYWETRIPRLGYNPRPLEGLDMRPQPNAGMVITEGIKPPKSRGKPIRPTGDIITEGWDVPKKSLENGRILHKSIFPKFTFTPTFDIKINNFSLGVIVGIIVTLLLKGC